MLEFANHISDISSLCSNHKVRHLYAFGSAVTNKFNSESDIDFLVDFYPLNSTDYADNYYDLKFALESMLNRRIDLLEEKALKNPYFLKAIENSKQLIYGK